MKRDQTDHAISLLVLWHRWSKPWGAELGLPTECPSTRGWRASRQYDDMNGAQETDERGLIAANVGRILESMEDPYKTALYLLAKSRATGVAVWRSVKLPDDRDACAEITAHALAIFSERV